MKNISRYIKNCDVANYDISESYFDKNIVLFGKDIRVIDNKWMWHLHLKITNTCNAKCFFCIEKESKEKVNELEYIRSVNSVLSEMKKNGILFSVSITGGEPTTFKRLFNLLETINKYNPCFLTLNSNGSNILDMHKELDGNLDFINISRHSIADSENIEIFGTNCVPCNNDLVKIKGKYKKTKIRIQKVLHSCETIEDIDKFIDYYSFCDDISIRRLMQPSEFHKQRYNTHKDLFYSFIENVNKSGKLIEQTIQDYYVYEIWDYRDNIITFSYSDMELLIGQESKEPDNIIREFILHPDLTFSGSWEKGKKVIRKF